MLREAQKSPRAANSSRMPLLNCTELTASTRVRLSQAAIRASSGAGPLMLTCLRETPGWASQGIQLEGNSSAVVTTLSPCFQRAPEATTEMASEVFLSRAMSSGEGALMSA